MNACTTSSSTTGGGNSGGGDDVLPQPNSKWKTHIAGELPVAPANRSRRSGGGEDAAAARTDCSHGSRCLSSSGKIAAGGAGAHDAVGQETGAQDADVGLDEGQIQTSTRTSGGTTVVLGTSSTSTSMEVRRHEEETKKNREASTGPAAAAGPAILGNPVPVLPIPPRLMLSEEDEALAHEIAAAAAASCAAALGSKTYQEDEDIAEMPPLPEPS